VVALAVGFRVVAAVPVVQVAAQSVVVQDQWVDPPVVVAAVAERPVAAAVVRAVDCQEEAEG
jgi:hypothetical protein